MKIKSLFDLVQDARDIVDCFENVTSVEQMVSRLERIKRNESADFLVLIDALKISLQGILHDTLEIGSSEMDDSDDDSDLEMDGLSDDEIASLEAEQSDEESKPEAS